MMARRRTIELFAPDVRCFSPFSTPRQFCAEMHKFSADQESVGQPATYPSHHHHHHYHNHYNHHIHHRHYRHHESVKHRATDPR